MSTTTRTAFLDSITMNNNNDSMIKRHKLSWYYLLYEYVQHMYMQFLLITTLYVMEPWERILMISIFLLVISLVTYSALIYIPFHLHYIFQSTIPSLSTVLIP